MNKQVLIISSSPRKDGNSEALCDEFLCGAVETGNVVVKVTLREKNINYCMGCGVCNTTHKCVQNDDMASLLEEMVKADVIVFATPVYFYTMCAQLKTFIDRCVPRYTEMKNKDVYYLLTAADTDEAMLKKTVDSLDGFTRDCLNGAVVKGIVYATGVWKKGEIDDTPFLDQALELGRNA